MKWIKQGKHYFSEERMEGKPFLIWERTFDPLLHGFVTADFRIFYEGMQIGLCCSRAGKFPVDGLKNAKKIVQDRYEAYLKLKFIEALT